MNALTSQFLLDPSITYLNFGSFGACPRPVFEDYQQWQRLLEREPVQFMKVHGPAALDVSRQALAGFVDCAPSDLVFVTNPSYAVNIVAKSLRLEPGDEILATDIEYGACDKIWQYYCNKAGAKYVRQPIALPIRSKEAFVEDLFAGLTARTKAVFISHITSATALVLPVAEICRIAREKGLLTIVDGAHAPAQAPLSISGLDPDVYTGACHKWMMMPKSSSFLYIREALQLQFDPLLISWNYEAAPSTARYFSESQEMQGTRDYSAFLTVPASLRFMQEHHWPAVARQCREMVRDNAPRFCDLFGTAPLAPLTEDFIGQLFSIPLEHINVDTLQDQLFQHYGIEIPVMRQNDKAYLRYSINGFNTQADLDKLYAALQELLQG